MESTIRTKTLSVICALITIFFLPHGAGAFDPGDLQYSSMPPCSPNVFPWTRFSKNGTRSDDAFRIKTDNCGNVYIAGTSDIDGNRIDIFVIKYNSEGDTMWTQVYNGRDSGSVSQDKIGDLAVDTSGNVYVCSASPGPPLGSYDFTTIKFNPDGVILWVKKIDRQYEDIPFAMCVDASGNVVVTGYSRASAGSAMYLTAKYNSSGDTLWTKTYTGENSDASTARSVCVDAGGNIYVTGNSAKFAQGNDYVTIKYNSSGGMLWNRRYNSPLGNSQDIPTSMTIDASSNIYITGYSDSVFISSSDYLTIKYNTNGDVLWSARYSAPGNQEDYALALAVNSGGNVAVTGYSRNTGGNFDMLTLYYSPSGIRQWEQRQAGTGNFNDVGRAVAFDASGNVYTAGNIYNARSDAAVYKYSPSGVIKGFRIFNGSFDNDDFFRAMSIDNLGNVHVAGRMNYNNFDCYSLTRKYPQNEFGYTLKLTAILQGFHYSSSTPFMRPDTVRVYVRSSVFPYAVVDSSKQVLNNVGFGEFFFTSISPGTNYYISLKHRNSIETWSAQNNWISFSADTTSYSFANSSAKAYGSNLKQVNSSPIRFAVYGGDANQDGTVDVTDLGIIDNDVFSFTTGYVVTDITGDNSVDISDLLIADNNAYDFVGVIRP